MSAQLMLQETEKSGLDNQKSPIQHIYKLNSIGSCLTKSYRAFPYRSSAPISLRGREKGFCHKSVVLHHMQDNSKCWRRKLLLQVNILCLNICCVPPSATTVRVDNDNWVSYRQSWQRGSVCEFNIMNILTVKSQMYDIMDSVIFYVRFS